MVSEYLIHFSSDDFPTMRLVHQNISSLHQRQQKTCHQRSPNHSMNFSFYHSHSHSPVMCCAIFLKQLVFQPFFLQVATISEQAIKDLVTNSSGYLAKRSLHMVVAFTNLLKMTSRSPVYQQWNCVVTANVMSFLIPSESSLDAVARDQVHHLLHENDDFRHFTPDDLEEADGDVLLERVIRQTSNIHLSHFNAAYFSVILPTPTTTPLSL